MCGFYSNTSGNMQSNEKSKGESDKGGKSKHQLGLFCQWVGQHAFMSSKDWSDFQEEKVSLVRIRIVESGIGLNLYRTGWDWSKFL